MQIPNTPHFELLILSMSNAALVNLGAMPDTNGAIAPKDLDAAAQNIDMVSMLQNKTKGNLTSHESKLIEEILYDLRIKYIEAARNP